VLDTVATLPDGRVLAYTDLGASDGPVVFYFHGAPTSRLDLVGHDDAFHAAGVRVVSPDRPGYGGSSPLPDRRREDWSADVAALADALGVDRFAVTGISSGGPYVVACAALLRTRVASAAVLAGVTDMAWPQAWDGYMADEADLMRLGDEDAVTTCCEDRYGIDGAGYLTGEPDLSPPDLAFMAHAPTARAVVANITEAFRQGVGGYAQDIACQARPWSFDPAAIAAPLEVLHGEADTLVPVGHARHTAELVPGAVLTTFPDHGHLSMWGEFPRVVSSLAASIR
jgi:pimeloyl-ACP methyl ester carboxylesterase